VIIFVDVFAGYLPDFAIFNFNVHDPVEPIVNFVGLLFGDKTHEPVFDHVLTPGEFVVATFDRLLTWPAVMDDTFHVTVVFVAAATELAVTPPNNPATINTPVRKLSLERMKEHYNTPANPSRRLANRMIGDSVRQVFVKMFRKVRWLAGFALYT